MIKNKLTAMILTRKLKRTINPQDRYPRKEISEYEAREKGMSVSGDGRVSGGIGSFESNGHGKL